MTSSPGFRVRFRTSFSGCGWGSLIGHSIRTARTSFIGSGKGSGKRCLWEGRTGICIGTAKGSAKPSCMPQDSIGDCWGACPGQGDPGRPSGRVSGLSFCSSKSYVDGGADRFQSKPVLCGLASDLTGTRGQADK